MKKFLLVLQTSLLIFTVISSLNYVSKKTAVTSITTFENEPNPPS